MTQNAQPTPGTKLRNAFQATQASDRLNIAMAAGIHPDPEFIDVLVEQCAGEPDFFVRDMLSWALMNQEREATLERVIAEVRSPVTQARSQALHTLSKLMDPRGWSAISVDVMYDSDDTVATTAWRAAAKLVPADEAGRLATILATQLGRGDHATQRALSRVLVDLADAAQPALDAAKQKPAEAVRAHALATERLRAFPDEGFDVSLLIAQRVAAIQGAPLVEHLEA